MIKTAVIGVGNMGKNHARIYHELTNSQLIAVADSNPELKIIAERYGAKFYTDYKEMLDKEEINAISIVVPTRLHKEVAVNCFKSGKHVLLEKPIAPSISEAEEIINASKQANKTLAIGHIERFNPVIKELKKIIQEGGLGRILSVVTKRIGVSPPDTKDNNVVIDLAIHDIDISNHLFDSIPSKVYSITGSALSLTSEDYATILLEYEGKASASIHVNWITPTNVRQLSINGTEGYAELDYVTQKLVVYPKMASGVFSDFKDFVEKYGKFPKIEIPIPKKEPLKQELEEFLKCIEEGKAPLIGGNQGLDALKIAIKALNRTKKEEYFKHPSAEVSEKAKIKKGTKIWNNVQVRENSKIGENCIISKDVYIDHGVIIGDNVKIQNSVPVYNGVTLEEGVFIGPYATFTNDKLPRAINPDGSQKAGGTNAFDWKISTTLVKKGASIGANSTILSGITIGEWALIGAGSVVTKDVPEYGLVMGNPAKLKGFVCPCGKKLEKISERETGVVMQCRVCGKEVIIPKLDYNKINK